MTPETLEYINTGLLSIIAAGGGFAYQLLSKMDRRVTKLEDFRENHEKWCGDRNDRNEREHGEFRANIRDLARKEGVHGPRDD